jgi:hypothetical protein
VLINGNSFSTTAELLSHLHARRRAVFIGEEAGGEYTGNTAGWFAELTLPHSGVQVSIPLASYLLGVPAPVIPGRGVMPTHSVRYTIAQRMAGRDLEMELATRLAREAIRSRRAPREQPEDHR